jgi:hypothetical protein
MSSIRMTGLGELRTFRRDRTALSVASVVHPAGPRPPLLAAGNPPAAARGDACAPDVSRPPSDETPAMDLLAFLRSLGCPGTTRLGGLDGRNRTRCPLLREPDRRSGTAWPCRLRADHIPDLGEERTVDARDRGMAWVRLRLRRARSAPRGDVGIPQPQRLRRYRVLDIRRLLDRASDLHTYAAQHGDAGPGG